MYLSRLDIFGFKSFAQKVVFKFDEGLTGIIGPNGCGKSNIVDAIRWVLGEQRPSILRCERMENLIFNGTATRKPLGMAEVSMYIENNKNILPSEYSEIKITRRLYRSGESEYLLNNQVVRLMDIINLFADTGMGADAYSVIELKMVEQILSDNAIERRRLFEEASGIKKYKARRKSALNKLDTTQQELLRLDDIIAEVQKSVNSLARQVGKARRYHEYKQQLKEKELFYSYLKIHSLQSELNPLQLELKEVERTRTSFGKEVHTLEAQLEEVQRKAVQTEQVYRNTAEDFFHKEEMIQELKNQLQLRRQKIDSLTDTIKNYRSEVQQQKQKQEELTKQLELLREKQTKIREQMTAAQEIYREAANQQLQAEEVYQKAREEYQTFVQANLEAFQQSGDVKEAYQKVLLEQDNFRSQLQKQEEQLTRIRESLREKEEMLQSLQEEKQQTTEEMEMYQKELQFLENKLEELKEKEESLRKELSVNEGKKERLENRKGFLENLIKNYEGFSQSVQYVMSQKSRYQGIVDTLANLVSCEEVYQGALESYLQEVSNYLVVKEEKTAREIIEHLRKDSKGRLTVIPMTLLSSNHHPRKEFPAPTEQMIPLLDVVSYQTEYEPLFKFLFHGVYLVDNLEEALQLHQQYPEVTFVTRDGDILGYWGNLTGGSSHNGTGLIGRKKQYEKVCAELAEMVETIGEQEKQLHEWNEEREKNQQKKEEFLSLSKSAEQQLMEVEKKISQQQYEIQRLSDISEELERECENLKDALSRCEEQQASLQPQIQVQTEQLEKYREQEKQLLGKLKELEQQLKSLTATTQEKQITYLNLTGEEKELSQQYQFTEQGIEDTRKFISERESRVEQLQSQVEDLEKECVELEKKLESAYAERDEAEERKNKVEQELQELKNVIQIHEADLKKYQRLWNQSKERLQELELRIREIQVKLETLKDQVKEKYGEEALKFDIKELDPTLTLAGLQDEIATIKQKLESLGDVNPLAIKEHEKEKERLNFLNTQKEDLLAAREQLLETIHKLNTTARKQFMETFQKIQNNFQRVFQEFFEGGKAELTLIESKDPLEANIDIAITHKGKKLNTLTLLSAGEKTLTAISLLFAIYLVKPSPFCILDEVDAPLDDVNIVRFTKALKQFTRDTQFILVTHNKKTMEAVNSLYGITMEEQGVSKVVSVKLD